MFRCVPWLWLAPIVAGLYGVARWSDLPDRVASHFAADGRADGWMEKGAFFAVVCGAMVLVAGLFTLLRWVIVRAPQHVVNVPHCGEWMGPEHRAATVAKIAKTICAIGFATQLFLIAVVYLVVELNVGAEQPPRIGAGSLFVLGTYVLVVLFLAGSLAVRFGRAPPSRQS